MISISEIVLNNLSDDVLRSMQNELVVKVEALRADDIAPSRGVVIAIKEINDILNRRLERENETLPENGTREQRWQSIMNAEVGCLWPSEKAVIEYMFERGVRDIKTIRETIMTQRPKETAPDFSFSPLTTSYRDH